MLKLKTYLTPITLSLALIIATPVMAKKDRGHNRDDMRQIMSQLSLTDVQKQDIKEIMKQSRQDSKLFRGDDTSFRTELHTLIQSVDWNQTEIENALTQHHTAISEKMLQRAAQKNQVWNTLTPAQQAEYSALLSEKMGTFEQRKENKKGKRNKHKAAMPKGLALTDAQKAEVKMIHEQAKETNDSLKAKFKEFKQAERSLISSSDFNSDKWLALSSQYNSDFVAMAVSQAKVRHDVWNALTAEQQQKMAQKMEKMQERGKHGKKHKKQKTV